VLGREPVYFGIAVPTAICNPQVISALANRLFKIVHMRIPLLLRSKFKPWWLKKVNGGGPLKNPERWCGYEPGDKPGGFDMANIPLDLQRRFEQRWVAKFFFRPDPNAPKMQELKTQVQQQAAAGEGKRRTRRVRRVGINSAPAVWAWNRRSPALSKKGANMTDDQVNRIVEHLCEQLHVAIRLKGAPSEVFPPNVKDLGFDPASVRTVLLTGLQVAGVMVHHAAPETNEEPPWS
jgi:hypothetical protein